MSGVPVKAMKEAFGQCRSHVEGEGIVLAPVRLIGDDDDVGTFREDWMHLATLSAELVDQGKDVAVIFPQEPP